MQGDPLSDDAENPQRGLGLPDVRNGTRDVRLLAMALKEHWPMTAKARKAAIRQLQEVVSEPGAIRKRPRSFHAALKALMGLSRINLDVVATVIKATEHEEILERLAELERQAEPQDRPP
jgi:hypothetical protein